MYCSHFTLGNQKSHFSTVSFIHACIGLLQIIFVISEENKLLFIYPPHLKKVTTLPCKMRNFFISLYVAFLQTLVALKKSRLWVGIGGSEKKPVVMCGKWNVRQATLQQMFKVTTFCTDTCFQSFSPLINCIVHHALLKFSPCRNASATRPYRGLVLHTREQMKKMKNLCILQGNAVTFFRCGTNSLFLLR